MDSKGRRGFLKTVAGAGLLSQSELVQIRAAEPQHPAAAHVDTPARAVQYPRVFTGRRLAMLAFPLGGVAAGSISLGGRGQLRDWEIFNRPDKGNTPSYALPAIWVQAGSAKSIARVLEARFLPPYEGSSGLGANNAPGLARLAGARFTGEYPMARVDFQDRKLPVKVALDAFSPFIPLDPEGSGLPIAVLRYQVTNPGAVPAKVSIAWSIDNPVGAASARGNNKQEARVNEVRTGGGLDGLLMTNPGLAAEDPDNGSFALCVLGAGDGKVSRLRGWPKGRWWNSPMLFWDDFSEDGSLGPEPAQRSAIGAVCLERTIPAGGSVDYTFLLAWHFPNRTPRRCGWSAPKDDDNTIIGNYYCTRFKGAWEAAEYAAANLDRLETATRQFVQAVRETTMPPAVKDAAMANLSTLATTTCFRTADGEFHGFEGVNDKSGCCFGNCTHVWNYETATAHLFPTFSRSLRKAAFGYSMDEAGAIHFRQLLPEGKARSGFAAADGQMGQILHAHLDWKLSGDTEWLRKLWPRIKKAVEFAWVPGGWDGDRDGVMEGVQHNTYDVEFYGPNPQCGIYYLGALRAAEEMARAAADTAAAAEYGRLFENGRRWIDTNLFNGEFYIQKIRGVPKEKVAPALRSDMGSEDTETPEYQVGEGCLVDQLVGQYLAEVCGLGPLLDPQHLRTTLEAIYRYNHRSDLSDHQSVQRTYALNDEAALLVCDYGKAQRPRIPFPYYAEAWTGLEYTVGSHMLYAGMIREGVECIRNVRVRYDGERRNPWDEAECGHHYARAMAAWSGMLALSGFRYDGPEQAIIATPRIAQANFRSFWSTGTAWGTFTSSRTKEGSRVALKVLAGRLDCRSCEIKSAAGATSAAVNGKPISHHAARKGAAAIFRFDRTLTLEPGSELVVRCG
ncbi:MAG TPA: GH116 family glycosyl-hydrolase [Bryobacteraceae bacterium]|nr:GH116 family glycosyl-hydrolase [Bryobacteraceae bacterium]